MSAQTKQIGGVSYCSTINVARHMEPLMDNEKLVVIATMIVLTLLSVTVVGWHA
jgi:aspartate-semialdehyde dehydrogenase